MPAKINRITGVSITCSLLVAATMMTATAEETKPFRQETSGWLNRTAVDVDLNGESLNSLTTFGPSSFGHTANNEVGETGPFAGVFCEFDPAAGIVIVEIPILTRSRIMRFANGDMMFASMATDGSVSRLCVDVNSEINTSEVHLVVTGGTGKFEGATGTLLLTAKSTTVMREAGFPVHVAMEQRVEGAVVLADND